MISRSVGDTIRLGKIIAKNLKKGDIICLFGDLGSGKTVLTKGIAMGLGIRGENVISPSFVLIRRHYQGRMPLYHFDLYRLKGPGDIVSLGCEEYFYGEGAAVIEWAERLKFLLPENFLKIELSFKSLTRRSIKLSARGRRYIELAKKIQESRPFKTKKTKGTG